MRRKVPRLRTGAEAEAFLCSATNWVVQLGLTANAPKSTR